MTFAPSFERVFKPVFWQPASAGWWTVAGQTCVAAYQPKGAASLAASYVNLAQPGTYNVAPGVAPTWAAATGWTFANLSLQYLYTTGLAIANNQTCSIVVRYSDAVSPLRSILVSVAVGTSFGELTIAPTFDGNYMRLRSRGFNKDYPPIQTSGIVATCGRSNYHNANLLGLHDVKTDGSNMTAMIFAAQATGGAGSYYGGKIQAAALYSTTLSADDVTTLTARMNAL